MHNAFSFRQRLRIYMRDCFTCRYCDRAMNPLSEDLTLDHADPEGGNEDSNLVTACRTCNSRKGSRTPAAWTAANLKPATRARAPLEVLDETAGIFGVPISAITSARRDRILVDARRHAARVMRDELGMTLQAIATHLGRADHTTIRHLLGENGVDINHQTAVERLEAAGD